LPIVEPDDGGEELCSLAPPDVSALPVGGMVADLDASGDVALVVGGCVDVSAAKIGVAPMTNTAIAIAKRRVISCTFLVVDDAQRFGLKKVHRSLVRRNVALSWGLAIRQLP
jgi:hypothetical protein